MEFFHFRSYMLVYCFVFLSIVTMAINAKEMPQDQTDILEKLASMVAEKKSTFGITIPKASYPPKKEETEVEKAERATKGFERMIQMVNILGQVDNFISDRTKSVIRKLNAMYDVEEKEKSGR